MVTETKKTVKMLPFACLSLALFGICAFLTALIAWNSFGAIAGMAVTKVDLAAGAWLVVTLGVILWLSASGKSSKIMYFTAACMELAGMAASFLLCGPIARTLASDPESANWMLLALRAFAVCTLIGCLAAIPVGMWLRNRSRFVFSVVLGTAAILTVAVSWFMINVLYSGIQGCVLGFFQPFCVFPLIAVPIGAPQDEGAKGAAYSHLEQYKQQMKNGGNKNV